MLSVFLFKESSRPRAANSWRENPCPWKWRELLHLVGQENLSPEFFWSFRKVTDFIHQVIISKPFHLQKKWSSYFKKRKATCDPSPKCPAISILLILFNSSLRHLCLKCYYLPVIRLSLWRVLFKGQMWSQRGHEQKFPQLWRALLLNNFYKVSFLSVSLIGSFSLSMCIFLYHSTYYIWER